ncbi:hypothetical protein [Synechococcus sp. CCY 0621]|uniref:hypothetical protein n=1 Tax=Synechococcus sp. CCY 0621 TaxID=2815603 RepID=UPI001C242FFE|nr:hypothetical protein [Synechococcus sp. CCY 0621]
MQEKKPRRTSYSFTTADKVDNIEIGVRSGKDGTLEVCPVTEVKEAHVTTQYERPKKPKILTKVPTGDRPAKVNINEAIADYDLLLAVDTNTKEVAGYRLSVTSVVMARLVPTPNAGLSCNYEIPLSIEFTSIHGNPERIGWVLALKELLRCSLINQSSRIGMVVDSELGLLAEFNSRRQPLFGCDFLLGGVELIYGGSDGGAELIPNKLIRKAEKASAALLKEIVAGAKHGSLRTLTPRSACTSLAFHWNRPSAGAIQHQDAVGGSNHA